jgi:RNA polymerase sigma factor (sigma-70 family)
MDNPARYRWIATHVLCHESELRGWLRRRMHVLADSDVDDLVQEAFARIWKADFSTIHNGRAYFYATVRHLLAEYARRSRIVPIELLGELDSLNLISDEPSVERRVGARQELDQLRLIVEALPAQCRLVFELRKFEGLAHKEIARRMGISEKTVGNHLTRALAQIGEALARGTTDAPRSAAAVKQFDDTDHGTD